MPKLDLTSVPEREGSSYPAPFDRHPAKRIRQRIGDAGGLTQFAAGNRALIVRRVGNHTEQLPVKLDSLLKDGDISANVQMRPGDILVIPQSWF